MNQTINQFNKFKKKITNKNIVKKIKFNVKLSKKYIIKRE